MTTARKIAVAGLLMFASTAASAQCRLCENSTPSSSATAPTGDVELQIETNLNFDRMILEGAGGGAATIRPDGSNGVEGTVLELGPRATVGTVLVHGEPNRSVRIDVPRRIQLFSLGGGQITLDDVTTDVSTVARLDGAGNMSFRFGGRVVLSGDCDGPYRGDLPITVEYQ